MQRTVENFERLGRRFRQYGDIQSEHALFKVIDDYGHHPTEMAATMAAMRAAWPESRLVVLFQPHRYTRTRDLFEDFVQVLSEPDLLVLMDVYPASEEPIPGADGRALSGAIRMRGKVNPVFVANIEEVYDTLNDVMQEGDVLLTLGAGNVGSIAGQLSEELAKIKEQRAS